MCNVIIVWIPKLLEFTFPNPNILIATILIYVRLALLSSEFNSNPLKDSNFPRLIAKSTGRRRQFINLPRPRRIS